MEQELSIGTQVQTNDLLFEIIEEYGRGVKYIGNHPIKKGEKVMEFEGLVVEKKDPDYKEAYNTWINYAVELQGKHILIPDADDEDDIKSVAFLVNTEVGNNNCKLSVTNARASIVATKKIKPGDIIHVSYGRKFANRLKKAKKPARRPKGQRKEVIDLTGDDDEEKYVIDLTGDD